MVKKAIVLLSGGLDSATTLAVAKKEGYEAVALSFRYGQRHSVELLAAQAVAEQNSVVSHKVIDIDLAVFGQSALTTSIDVPVSRSLEEMNESIPVTYVPARNTVFLSYALALADSLSCNDIFIGVNQLDYAGYPDCRPEFIKAFEMVANLGTRTGVEGETVIKIHTPVIDLTKTEVIKLGLELGVDYSKTHSCYSPDEAGLACGVCDACSLRLMGFAENGIKDPIKYVGSHEG